MINKKLKRNQSMITIVSIFSVCTIIFLGKGYFYPIKRGTVEGGITMAIGTAIIILVSFGLLVLLHFAQKKKK